MATPIAPPLYTAAATLASGQPASMYRASRAVGNGMAATKINSSRLRNRSGRSTWAT
jgi:hypothetical protein